MKTITIHIISFYQLILSPDKGFFSRGASCCAFYPSCSEYTKEAIIFGGVWYGVKKGFLRIMRCHPWQKKYYDSFTP